MLLRYKVGKCNNNEKLRNLTKIELSKPDLL
jgi:hypothetical protein